MQKIEHGGGVQNYQAPVGVLGVVFGLWALTIGVFPLPVVAQEVPGVDPVIFSNTSTADSISIIDVGGRHTLSQQMIALSSGPIKDMDVFLAQEMSGFSQEIRLQVFDEAGTRFLCTFENNGPAFLPGIRVDQWNMIPVGTEPAFLTWVATDQFGDLENCTFIEGTTYTIQMETVASGVVAATRLFTAGNAPSDFYFVARTPYVPPLPPPTLPPQVPGVILAKSSDESWNRNGWDKGIFYGNTRQIDDNNIVQEGVIAYVTFPLGYFYDDPTFPAYFYLEGAFGNSYDCRTPEKTISEWGIYNNSQGNGWNTVTVGPFSGGECDTALRHIPARGETMFLRARNSAGSTAVSYIGTPGYRHENNVVESPFIAYSATPAPPVCTENCFSNVLFLPGFLGSRLYTTNEFGLERSLWEPNGKRDLADLALNPDGTSKLPIYVGDPVDSINNLPIGFTIYEDLMGHLDGLSGSKINAWAAYPYDWRYDVFDVVDDGTLKQDGSRSHLATVLQELADNSRTEKVTIVAHSNGGLLAKALMLRLAAEGKEGLVDRIVFVGTPQVGTPQGLLGLLHGDKIFPPYLALASEARASAASMPGAYGLAPSAEYFNRVSTPMATFAPGSQTDAFRAQYGDALDSYEEIVSFMNNVPSTRNEPGEQDEETPLSLPMSLITTAETAHAALDAWTPSAGVQVHEVVGWGNDTAVTARYFTETTFSCPTGPLSCGLHPSIDYKPLRVNDGDDTVVAPSASYLGSEAYFDLDELRDLSLIEREFRKHENLTESPKFHQYFDFLLGIETTYRTDLFVGDEPDGAGIESTTISIHSPAIFFLTDEEGNETGIFPISGSDLYYYKEEIPHSSVFFGGEGKYVSVPSGKTYQVRVQGIGTGTFDLVVENSNEEVVEHFNDVPVTPNTVAATELAGGDTTTLVVDENGDGQPDSNVAPEGGVLSIAELLMNLKTAVNGLSTANPNQKARLLDKITNIENKIEKQKQKQKKILGKLQAKITKKVGKGKIDATTADAISALLDELLAQSSLVPLDAVLTQQLKEQITVANISIQLKTSLLNKVARLENLTGISRSLSTMTQAVLQKGAKGVLVDAETQNLLNLLDQLQGAL